MTDIVIRGPVTLTGWECSVLRKWGNGDAVAWAAREAIRAAAAEPVRRAVAAWSGDALSRALERWAASLAYVLHQCPDAPLAVARHRRHLLQPVSAALARERAAAAPGAPVMIGP